MSRVLDEMPNQIMTRWPGQKTVGELQEFAVFLESRPLQDLASCL